MFLVTGQSSLGLLAAGAGGLLVPLPQPRAVHRCRPLAKRGLGRPIDTDAALRVPPIVVVNS